MANIITYEYFRGPISLPHTANTQGQALLTQFITQYENEFLIKALGLQLKKGLLDNIASADQKWTELRDGVGFENSYSQDDEWIGFKNDDTKISPIANYVYYQFVKNQITQTALAGEVQTATENATRVYPQLKLVEAWNLMADMICKLHDWLRLNPDTYPEFNFYRPNGVVKRINQFGI